MFKLKHDIVYPFLDIVFPQGCVLCAKIVKTEEKVFPVCIECDKTLKILFKKEKIDTDVYMFSLGNYSDELKILIQKFKYYGIKNLGKYFSNKIYFEFKQEFLNDSFDAICCVPIHISRFYERTYNQTEVFAKYLSRLMKNKVIKNLLQKKKDTISQTQLKKSDRLVNILGSFRVNKINQLKKINKILLIDDIYTTGSTLKECIRVLKEANTNLKVSVVVIAKT